MESLQSFQVWSHYLLMKTLKEEVLELLKTGNGYTTLDILRHCHTIDGRKIISMLRKEGYTITSITQKGEHRGRHWNRYFLKESL